MPAGRPTKLTAEVRQLIVAAIRAGAWDYIAAEAAGIDDSQFYRWMVRGKEQPKSIYGQFRREVEQAYGQARLAAELRVHQERPFEWLRSGPGRERTGRPGWSDHQISVELQQGPTVNLFLSQEWIVIEATLLEALSPYPEARAAVVAALEKAHET